MLHAVLRASLLMLVIGATGAILGIILNNKLDAHANERLRERAEAVARVLGETPPRETDRIIESSASLLGLTVAEVPSASMIAAPADARRVLVGIPGRDTFLEVTDSSPGLAEQANSILIAFSWLTGTALVAGISVVAWRTRRNQQALQSALDGASRFEAGDLSHRIPLTGAREWDHMSISLNRMARQLSQQIRSIRVQRLQQSAILESMSSAVIALDRNHQLLSANQAAELLFGLGPSSQGRPLLELLNEPELHRIVEHVLTSNMRETREFESQVLEGRLLSVIAEPMRVTEQKTIGAVILVDDVSDIRRLESMRSDFAANVSHELRTPITNIQGYVETLQEIDLGDTAQARKFLGIVQRNAERLGMIIEDLLTLARLEEPEDATGEDLHPVSLDAIIEEVIDRQGPAAQRRSIELILEGGEGFEVRTRGDLLVEAISNLVSNAIRYGPESAPVRIRMSEGETPDMLEITVIDQGPGIPQEHVPRLFERFYRVDKARSRTEGGTGLGLAIVKHIALVHGGSVRVETAAGAGAAFTLEIPGSAMPTANVMHTPS